MSSILIIDTSGDSASVIMTENERMLQSITNDIQNEHAAFLHKAIIQLTEKTKPLNEVDAIAVSAGPGSYTGLRIGMASAKGLCYALDRPLITIGTLPAMARAMISAGGYEADTLFCPMIDARRMEAYVAVYDSNMAEVVAPASKILDKESFSDIMKAHRVIFFGSGAEKWKALIQNEHATFLKNVNINTSLCLITHEKYKSKDFTDLIYSEPAYLKEFFTG